MGRRRSLYNVGAGLLISTSEGDSVAGKSGSNLSLVQLLSQTETVDKKTCFVTQHGKLTT